MVNKNVARLELPQTMGRLHDSFNVDVLRHYVPTPDRFTDRQLPKVSPVDFAAGSEGDGLHNPESSTSLHFLHYQLYQVSLVYNPSSTSASFLPAVSKHNIFSVKSQRSLIRWAHG
ncbi:hypothetical protein PI124_g8808 [Phytophthora idaei]|nr:hypothetical protein PI125_g16705 [Phytophthora idaei]KAG3246489.1 hypothetical protein PI124_g8808 [Phytophthora idaei]